MQFKLIYVLILLLLAGGCIALLINEPARFSRPSSGLIVSHATHLEEMSCTECHMGGKGLASMGMPAKDSCQDCHDEADHSKKEVASCYKCHNKPIRKPLRIKPAAYADVSFNHSKHNVTSDNCSVCHGGVASTMGLSEIALPEKEETCQKCHEDDIGRADGCGKCHTLQRMNRKPASHDRSWKRFHGDSARDEFYDKSWYNCMFCHQEAQCDSCHGQEQPRNHTEMWYRKTHAISASVDRMRCAVCHQEDICIRCHKRRP